MPDLANEFVAAVREARQAGASLSIVGNGSKSFIGRTVAGSELNVAGHAGIVSYEPTELVITARGGTTLAQIDAALAEHDQYLASDPPRCGGKATIAGTLASNLSGPGRPWAGSLRDHVLGIRLINGRGEHLRYGGTVMKNVTGYDVSRLQAGALGTLGIITEVSLRVQPRPQCAITLQHEVEAESALPQMNAWSRSNLPVSAAAWVDGRLLLRLAGDEQAIPAVAERVGGMQQADGDAFWQELREFEHPFFADAAPLWRFSVPSGSVLRPADDNWCIDWGGAQRWVRGDFDMADLEREAASLSGQVSLFRGGRRDGEVFHVRTDAQRVIHQRLKAAFDPDRVLNPGRLYSWM